MPLRISEEDIEPYGGAEELLSAVCEAFGVKGGVPKGWLNEIVMTNDKNLTQLLKETRQRIASLILDGKYLVEKNFSEEEVKIHLDWAKAIIELNKVRCLGETDDDGWTFINHWTSSRAKNGRQRKVVNVFKNTEGRYKHIISLVGEPWFERLSYIINTNRVSTWWHGSVAESKAQELLESLTTIGQFRSFQLTGTFQEIGQSGVVYIFRRGRPTIAARVIARQDGLMAVEPLCALCLHPGSYYGGTWAGGMVPTDDLIAHLLLVRSCEYTLWKRSGQHPLNQSISGL